ncbi:MAG: c-type cytochrome [Halieaceae bacterium]|jgi:cytochrome c553|nr:c-type cytochrome [Halieaceae bacterium]
MRKWIIASVLVLSGAGLAHADDMPAKAQACVACHGQTGVSSNPEWPNLAGQHAAYLAIQITAFRDGTRENPVMAPFVAGLTDADIAALAAYYAAQPRVTAANGDKALVGTGENLSGYCKACHGMQGVPVADEWPVLAGQHAPYLQKQLAAYKSGARLNPLMQSAIAHLGAAEFAALAAYYSQLAP